ncbi:putative metalloprotease CJM1_0395 family protein [Thermodesulfobacteriota bacterium B35]
MNATSPLTALTASQPVPGSAIASSGRLHTEPARRITPAPSAGGGDRVTISAQGREEAARAANQDTAPATAATDKKRSAGSPAAGPAELDMAELRMVERLKLRDREVKAHELAHLANAGQYATGGPSYTYQQGPDGRRYAVGGEVPIDISAEQAPEATIQKMRTVRRAAMAPANPSAADRNIAALASRKEAEARQEMRQEENEKQAARPDNTDAGKTAPPDTSTAENTGPAVSPQRRMTS